MVGSTAKQRHERLKAQEGYKTVGTQAVVGGAGLAMHIGTDHCKIRYLGNVSKAQPNILGLWHLRQIVEDMHPSIGLLEDNNSHDIIFGRVSSRVVSLLQLP